MPKHLTYHGGLMRILIRDLKNWKLYGKYQSNSRLAILMIRRGFILEILGVGVLRWRDVFSTNSFGIMKAISSESIF